MKKRYSTIILIVLFVAGLSLLLYPTVSNFINSLHASKAIVSYDEEVEEMEQSKKEELFENALKYNEEKGASDQQVADLSASEKERYESLLNIGGDGVMGYIEIPSLDVNLPIYHGTEESVLQIAAGHLEWTSLPVGGENSHCVLSGHRGLPRAKLFTDIDKLVEGDIFTLHVLDEVLTYEVDQIRIVEPQDISELMIVKGMDLCTLVTCTPYGINTHRLLVRGHRIATEENKVHSVTANASAFDPFFTALIIAVVILFVMLLRLFIRKPKKAKE